VFDRKVSPEVSREFLDWLDEVDDRPFFAFLNYFDAHAQYYAPAKFRQPYHSDNDDLDAYDAAIGYLDDELGKLFAELERRGVLDNTIVVVTSDHGEAFGEHGLWTHGNSLYEIELHVPLIVRHPATVPAGIRVPGFVSLRNLPATLTDLTGGPAEFQGSSLATLWSARDSAPWGARNPVLAEVNAGIRAHPHEPVSRGPMRSLFTEPYHFLRNGDGREEFYDLRRDPGELLDLGRTRPGQQVLPRLGFALDAHLNGRSAHAAVLGQ
jgi:arylsulfatase A-like enzyme